jgi:TolA-binding protein
MQTQDAPAEIVFKLWPWIEANRKFLIGTVAAAIVVFFIWFYISTQRQETAVEAGLQFTQFQMSQPPNATAKQVADNYLVIASRFPNTETAQRARLQAAAVLFSSGDYTGAQAGFQSFLSQDGGSSLAALAQFGVAASLEAQGKLDDALAQYRAAAASEPNSPNAFAALFAEGRVLELQGKNADALKCYEEVASQTFAGSLASEAAQRASVLKGKATVAQPAAKS